VPAGGGGGNANASKNDTSAESHRLIDESVLYQGCWRSLKNRRVVFSKASEKDKFMANFEVVCQAGTDKAVLILVWHSTTKSFTLIREYMPSVNKVLYGLAAGTVENDKHKNDSLIAAQTELQEEARLEGGTWHCLCKPTAMDKYSTTLLTAFLCINPVPIPAHLAPPRDELEDGLEVCPNVSLSKLRSLMESAQMTAVGGWAASLAIQRLQELGEISRLNNTEVL
jgi:hypothetical protein